MQQNKPSLAVIGTGIAGLSAAWLLRQKYDVTVYESQPRAGMGVHTIDYSSRGKTSRIDVPLRIFTRGYYQHLLALYDHIGVEVLASDHAGVFADGDGRKIFEYGNASFAGLDFSYLKGRSLFSPKAWKIALQSRRFFAQAEKNFDTWPNLAELRFEEYLQQTRAGPEFVETVLLPIMSVTCTCDYQSVLDYPADIMLGYLTSGVQELGIVSAANGVDDIVPRLLQGVELKTDSAVTQIAANGENLTVTTKTGETGDFDHVVVAAQAQQAAGMLSGFEDQKQLLGRVEFESSTMSVHTDSDLLPNGDEKLSPVSYFVPDHAPRAEVTVNLTRTISRLGGQDTVFQTWNPIRQPREEKELARVNFTRPVVSHQSRRAMTSLREYHRQQGNRLWFCGSYVAEKIPLLDAAVDSSVEVAKQLGVQIPWKVGSD